MLNGVLQLMYGLQQHHRQQPEFEGKPTSRRDRQRCNQRVAGQMPTRFPDDRGLAALRNVRLGHDAESESHDSPQPRIPVARPQEPQQIGTQAVARTCKLAVTLQVLGIAMVCEVLNLIEIARIEEQKAKHAAEKLVEPLSSEHSPMAEFV